MTNGNDILEDLDAIIASPPPMHGPQRVAYVMHPAQYEELKRVYGEYFSKPPLTDEQMKGMGIVKSTFIPMIPPPGIALDIGEPRNRKERRRVGKGPTGREQRFRQ